MKRDHKTGRSWPAPLAEIGYRRWLKRQQRQEAGAVPGPAPRAPEGILRAARAVALGLASLIVIAASAAAFAESYRGLWLWALRHGLAGFWAGAFPLQVDSFVAVGELALFVALADQWRPGARVLPWLVTLGGLAVSVAANVGHVTTTDLATKATAAVPPLAAATALAVGLGILKRVVTARRAPDSGPGAPWSPVPDSAESAAAESLRATLAAGNPWSGRQLETRFGLSRAQAAKVRELVLARANGHPPEDTPENTDQ